MSVEDTAKKKVMARFGDREWHPAERIESVKPATVSASWGDEDMFIVSTSSENILGARKNGRIALSFTENLDQMVGGIFYFEEGGKKKLQSVYVDSDFRGGVATKILADAAKSVGVRYATGPFSNAGKAFVSRYSFRIVESERNVMGPFETQVEKQSQNGRMYPKAAFDRALQEARVGKLESDNRVFQFTIWADTPAEFKSLDRAVRRAVDQHNSVVVAYKTHSRVDMALTVLVMESSSMFAKDQLERWIVKQGVSVSESKVQYEGVQEAKLDGIEKVRGSSLLLKLETSIIKKLKSLPGTAPLSAQLVESLSKIKKAMKPHMAKTGVEAVNAFIEAVRGHFNDSWPTLATLKRKYKLNSDFRGNLQPILTHTESLNEANVKVGDTVKVLGFFNVVKGTVEKITGNMAIVKGEDLFGPTKVKARLRDLEVIDESLQEGRIGDGLWHTARVYAAAPGFGPGQEVQLNTLKNLKRPDGKALTSGGFVSVRPDDRETDLIKMIAKAIGRKPKDIRLELVESHGPFEHQVETSPLNEFYDEAEKTAEFEKMVGGKSKAAELFRIYKNSHPMGVGFNKRTKIDVFVSKAKKAGFKDKHIDALLDLQ